MCVYIQLHDSLVGYIRLPQNGHDDHLELRLRSFSGACRPSLAQCTAEKRPWKLPEPWTDRLPRAQYNIIPRRLPVAIGGNQWFPRIYGKYRWLPAIMLTGRLGLYSILSYKVMMMGFRNHVLALCLPQRPRLPLPYSTSS